MQAAHHDGQFEKEVKDKMIKWQKQKARDQDRAQVLAYLYSLASATDREQTALKQLPAKPKEAAKGLPDLARARNVVCLAQQKHNMLLREVREDVSAASQ